MFRGIKKLHNIIVLSLDGAAIIGLFQFAYWMTTIGLSVDTQSPVFKLDQTQTKELWQRYDIGTDVDVNKAYWGLGFIALALLGCKLLPLIAMNVTPLMAATPINAVILGIPLLILTEAWLCCVIATGFALFTLYGCAAGALFVIPLRALIKRCKQHQ